LAHSPSSIPDWQSAGVSGPLLSPKRRAREAGEDPPKYEHCPCGNADERGSDQQRHPSQSQNSDEQRKEGDADGPQPHNFDPGSVLRTGGYPDARNAWPISARRDDLRLGAGRLGLWHWLLLHHVIRMNVPESCGRWRPIDNEGMLSNLEGERVSWASRVEVMDLKEGPTEFGGIAIRDRHLPVKSSSELGTQGSTGCALLISGEGKAGEDHAGKLRVFTLSNLVTLR
jgi:hypothetical protein